jgi:hypothetical protein
VSAPREQKTAKKRNKKNEAPPLQGDTQKAMKGKEPTLMDATLQRELRRHHMNLEVQVVEQNQPKSGDKSSGRQVFPKTINNLTGEPNMDTTTETTANNNQTHQSESPVDRLEALIHANIEQLRKQDSLGASARRGTEIAVGSFIGGLLVLGAVKVGTMVFSGAPKTVLAE